MDRELIKKFLNEQIKHHKMELTGHKAIYERTKSNRQKLKTLKHFHKMKQTQYIAEVLGFKYCEHCGELR